jgi:hypothetical protein
MGLSFDEARYDFEDKEVDTPDRKFPVRIYVSLPGETVVGGFRLENCDFGDDPASWTLRASNDVRDQYGVEIWTTLHEFSGATNLGRVSPIYAIA